MRYNISPFFVRIMYAYKTTPSHLSHMSVMYTLSESNTAQLNTRQHMTVSSVKKMK